MYFSGRTGNGACLAGLVVVWPFGQLLHRFGAFLAVRMSVWMVSEIICSMGRTRGQISPSVRTENGPKYVRCTARAGTATRAHGALWRPEDGPSGSQKQVCRPNTIFFRFRDPCCSGAHKGPCGASCLLLACCCLLLIACLLDAQVPPWWSNNLINRLKHYVLQLGDPNPNQDWVLGPS